MVQLDFRIGITCLSRFGFKVEKSADCKRELELLAHLGIKKFKIVPLPSTGRLFCSKSQVLMSGNTLPNSNKNKDEESIMITNSKDIVKNMQSLCEFLWETGKEISINKKSKMKEREIKSKQQFL